MSKHTPGPWTTTPGLFWVCKVGNNPNDPGVWSAHPVAENSPFPFGDKMADARLIAAAPDLLEALITAMDWIDNWSPDFVDDEEWPSSRDQIRAAIAKAKGEA